MATTPRDPGRDLDEPPPAPDEGLARAARTRTPLVGPGGHPFHPLVASVAVAAWAFSVAFDLASFVADQAWAYTRAAYVLTGLGVVVGAGAALLGLVDLLGVPRGTRAFRFGVRHLVAMDLALGLFAVSFVIRRGSDFAQTDPVDVVPFLLSLGGLAALATGVGLGHQLAYRFGVRVNVGPPRREGFEPDAAADRP
jgi:uncharacterized membrane protein